MQCADINRDKEGVRLSTVCAFVTSVEPEHDERQITANILIHKQANELYCLQVSSTIEPPGSAYNYGRNGLLTTAANIDCALQTVVCDSLQARPLHHRHYPRLVGHPGEKGMYNKTRKGY